MAAVRFDVWDEFEQEWDAAAEGETNPFVTQDFASVFLAKELQDEADEELARHLTVEADAEWQRHLSADPSDDHDAHPASVVATASSASRSPTDASDGPGGERWPFACRAAQGFSDTISNFVSTAASSFGGTGRRGDTGADWPPSPAVAAAIAAAMAVAPRYGAESESGRPAAPSRLSQQVIRPRVSRMLPRPPRPQGPLVTVSAASPARVPSQTAPRSGSVGGRRSRPAPSWRPSPPVREADATGHGHSTLDQQTMVAPFRSAAGLDDTALTECAICMEEFEDSQMVRTLPCLHRFHVSCVDKWLRSSRECPICKHAVDGSGARGS
eukprot:TRINITY_DN14330_c0_g1_i3.p1 TRINITY_DN14330_c0_g1~~TRINITY_DN14330_c0_g1_i3.p1  ORF type:complete len:327 (+),score=51.84 TRINITY_DN14330_c0_g1_i3:102-1082(+)